MRIEPERGREERAGSLELPRAKGDLAQEAHRARGTARAAIHVHVAEQRDQVSPCLVIAPERKERAGAPHDQTGVGRAAGAAQGAGDEGQRRTWLALGHQSVAEPGSLANRIGPLGHGRRSPLVALLVPKEKSFLPVRAGDAGVQCASPRSAGALHIIR